MELAFEVDRVLERYSGSLLEIVLSRRPASLVLLRAPIPGRSICIGQPEEPDEHDVEIERERKKERETTRASTAREISLECWPQKSRNTTASDQGTKCPGSYSRLCMSTTA